jgi:hypothetical protein
LFVKETLPISDFSLWEVQRPIILQFCAERARLASGWLRFCRRQLILLLMGSRLHQEAAAGLGSCSLPDSVSAPGAPRARQNSARFSSRCRVQVFVFRRCCLIRVLRPSPVVCGAWLSSLASV